MSSIPNLPRALVVDDELVIRRLVAKALRDNGFICETASDGVEATAMMRGCDLLVTDLRMPNKHGHTLVTEAIKLHQRPIIIVHTGIVERKLAADLFDRGIDDLFYKPADILLLAAKARALCNRRAGVVGVGIGAIAPSSQRQVCSTQ